MGTLRFLIDSGNFSGHNPHRILTFHVDFLKSFFQVKNIRKKVCFSRIKNFSKAKFSKILAKNRKSVIKNNTKCN
jgi:hypothetical protein